MQAIIKMAIIRLSKYEGELSEERTLSKKRKLTHRAENLKNRIETVQHCKQLIKDL